MILTMSGYRNGYIELDSPREVFYPGQVVLGNVVYEIEEPLSLVGKLFLNIHNMSFYMLLFWDTLNSRSLEMRVGVGALDCLN